MINIVDRIKIARVTRKGEKPKLRKLAKIARIRFSAVFPMFICS